MGSISANEAFEHMFTAGSTRLQVGCTKCYVGVSEWDGENTNYSYLNNESLFGFEHW